MKILCIGDLNGDLLIPYCKAKTKQYDNSNPLEVTFQGGGSVANTCRVLGKLKANPLFITDLCLDNFGKFLKEDLEKYGVNMDYSPIGNNSSIICVAVMDESNERIIFPWQPPNSTLPYFNKDSFSKVPLDDYIVFTGGMMLNNIEDTMQSVYDFIKYLKDNTNSKFMFDLNMRLDTYGYNERREYYYKKYVDLADIVTGSLDDELYPFVHGSSIEDVFNYFDNNKVVIARDGGHGTYILDHGKQSFVESEKVHVIHTIGAGDTFDATFLYAYQQDKSIQECVKLAGHAASYMISHDGYLILPQDL